MNGIETNRLGGGRGLKYLRFAPLFICLTLAAVVSGGVLLGAVLRLPALCEAPPPAFAAA